MEHIITAPFTRQQVKALNRWQTDSCELPLTCQAGTHQIHATLVAATDGWHCGNAYCNYTQNWAFDFMAHWPETPRPTRWRAWRTWWPSACAGATAGLLAGLLAGNLTP